MKVFISYRRMQPQGKSPPRVEHGGVFPQPFSVSDWGAVRASDLEGQPQGRPSPFVSSLYEALKVAGGVDEIFIDIYGVVDKGQFGTKIANGLERADALVVAIDDIWLSEVNLRWLRKSARAKELAIDWVDFEIGYAREFKLVVVVVGTSENLQKMRRKIPASVHDFPQALQFPTRGDRVTKSEGRQLMERLRRACSANPRLKGEILVDDGCNRVGVTDMPTKLSVIQGYDPSQVYDEGWIRVVTAIFWYLMVALVMGAIYVGFQVGGMGIAFSLAFLCLVFIGVWNRIELGFDKRKLKWVDSRYRRIHEERRQS